MAYGDGIFFDNLGVMSDYDVANLTGQGSGQGYPNYPDQGNPGLQPPGYPNYGAPQGGQQQPNALPSSITSGMSRISSMFGPGPAQQPAAPAPQDIGQPSAQPPPPGQGSQFGGLQFGDFRDVEGFKQGLENLQLGDAQTISDAELASTVGGTTKDIAQGLGVKRDAAGNIVDFGTASAFAPLTDQIFDVDSNTGKRTVKQSFLNTPEAMQSREAVNRLGDFAGSGAGKSQFERSVLQQQEQQLDRDLQDIASQSDQAVRDASNRIAQRFGLEPAMAMQLQNASAENRLRVSQQARGTAQAQRLGFLSEAQGQKLMADKFIPQAAGATQAMIDSRLNIAGGALEAIEAGDQNRARILGTLSQSDEARRLDALKFNKDSINQNNLKQLELDTFKFLEEQGLDKEQAQFEAQKVIADELGVEQQKMNDWLMKKDLDAANKAIKAAMADLPSPQKFAQKLTKASNQPGAQAVKLGSVNGTPITPNISDPGQSLFGKASQGVQSVLRDIGSLFG